MGVKKNKAKFINKAKVIRQKAKGIRNFYALMLVRLMFLCPFEKTKPNLPEAKVIRHKAKGIRNSYALMLIRLMLLCDLKKQSHFASVANQRIFLFERMLWQ